MLAASRILVSVVLKHTYNAKYTRHGTGALPLIICHLLNWITCKWNTARSWAQHFDEESWLLTFQADEVKVFSTWEIIPFEGSAGGDGAAGTGFTPEGVSLPVVVGLRSTRHPKPRASHQVPTRDCLISEHQSTEAWMCNTVANVKYSSYYRAEVDPFF